MNKAQVAGADIALIMPISLFGNSRHGDVSACFLIHKSGSIFIFIELGFCLRNAIAVLPSSTQPHGAVFQSPPFFIQIIPLAIYPFITDAKIRF